MKYIVSFGLLCMTVFLTALAAVPDTLYHELYRSQYHFSPRQGWIGDPCGFIYYQGKYQMYWWGKVESEDLVHYREVTPFAMKGAPENISYFTG